MLKIAINLRIPYDTLSTTLTHINFSCRGGDITISSLFSGFFPFNYSQCLFFAFVKHFEGK